MNIKDVFAKYSSQIDSLDLELLIAHTLKKSREFVLAHPEARVTRNHELRIMNYAKRRIKGEPVAYILGRKEFYGLDFKVNKNTLIPRPETEILVEQALQEFQELRSKNYELCVIDIGTGSGNIIISIASQLKKHESRIINYDLFGIDISEKALRVAKQNAKRHKVDKKIKFIKGNLLEPLLRSKKLTKLKAKKLVILANLPYLSRKIYSSAPIDVKKYEPKSALFSNKDGLFHYEKLLKQINKLWVVGCGLWVILEISPEQKNPLNKMLEKCFPKAKIGFRKDLAGKWRVCIIKL